MNAIPPTSQERAEKLEGIGCKRKRVEDVRFVQGKGNYVDDLKLPGMLYGDFVRSPLRPCAHQVDRRFEGDERSRRHGRADRRRSEAADLHYMPTLAGDVQAVLAEEKVLFQNQEVAFVVAEDRYIAADAVDLVEVEYEALPVLVDPFKAMAPDAPLLREDIKDKTRRRPRQAQALQPHLHLGDGRQGRDRRGVRARRGDDQGTDLLSARASLAAGDLPMRRLVRQDQAAS